MHTFTYRGSRTDPNKAGTKKGPDASKPEYESVHNNILMVDCRFLTLVKPSRFIVTYHFIIRFVIDGEDFTSFEGRKIPMRRGDVVIIPGFH
ncbi:hypothetical protein F4814DRAFT_407475 [Daldinia grandis]|nr:hypothetical protein F4814DRAFT_407475 [Daldinia grandis]